MRKIFSGYAIDLWLFYGIHNGNNTGFIVSVRNGELDFNCSTSNWHYEEDAVATAIQTSTRFRKLLCGSDDNGYKCDFGLSATFDDLSESEIFIIKKYIKKTVAEESKRIIAHKERIYRALRHITS
jgi:hypothetical protein